MNNSVHTISLLGLMLAFVPAAVVMSILYRWGLDVRTSLSAVTRMLFQLLLIGYVLVALFETDHAGIIMLVLAIMLVAASWIALRPLQEKRTLLYRNALLGIFVGSMLTLALVTQLVLGVEPWFLPRYVVPLAGMIIASSMNAVSLAAERFESEMRKGGRYDEARRVALQAALIPVTNSLFAVGLVSLPGMMTGQILSGISPFVAAKYQIVVMCMIFGASGVSAAMYLVLEKYRH